MKGDVYSFALILWEMMARKIPWEHCKLSFSYFFPLLVLILIQIQIQINVVNDVSEIEFQVRQGKREKIPNPQGDQNLELLAAIIELSWKQNANERPTFKQIDQKLSPFKNF